MSGSAHEGATGAPVPQELVIGLLGLCVLGRGGASPQTVRPLPTQVFLAALGALGISEAATRTTLNRMVSRGGLTRRRDGRTSTFEPTEKTIEMLRRGRARMFSPAPFEHTEGVWTILSCPIPESLRNVRYQLHARLRWAGFGMVQPNFWAAPGRIDAEALLGDILPAPGLVHAFHGSPTPPDSPVRLIAAGWDVEVLRRAHRDFTARWGAVKPSAAEALPQLLLLIDDWGRLLRTDPGLPLGDEHWPAERSTQIFRDLEALLGPQAERRIRQLAGPLGG